MPDPGDALGSLFLLGPVFSLSRWKRRLEEEGQGASKSEAAGDRQGLQVGAMCTEEWTDRPLSVCEQNGLTDTQRALRDRVRTELQQSVTPQAGFSLHRSQPSSVPPPHPSPARPTCVSRRARCHDAICGDP